MRISFSLKCKSEAKKEKNEKIFMRICLNYKEKATKQYYGNGKSQSHVVFILHWQKYFFAEKAQKEIFKCKKCRMREQVWKLFSERIRKHFFKSLQIKFWIWNVHSSSRKWAKYFLKTFKIGAGSQKSYTYCAHQKGPWHSFIMSQKKN